MNSEPPSLRVLWNKIFFLCLPPRGPSNYPTAARASGARPVLGKAAFPGTGLAARGGGGASLTGKPTAGIGTRAAEPNSLARPWGGSAGKPNASGFGDGDGCGDAVGAGDGNGAGDAIGGTTAGLGGAFAGSGIASANVLPGPHRRGRGLAGRGGSGGFLSPAQFPQQRHHHPSGGGHAPVQTGQDRRLTIPLAAPCPVPLAAPCPVPLTVPLADHTADIARRVAQQFVEYDVLAREHHLHRPDRGQGADQVRDQRGMGRPARRAHVRTRGEDVDDILHQQARHVVRGQRGRGGHGPSFS